MEASLREACDALSDCHRDLGMLKAAVQPFVPKCVNCGKPAFRLCDDGEFEIWVCDFRCAEEFQGVARGTEDAETWICDDALHLVKTLADLDSPEPPPRGTR
jgi:hypothetical protein